MSYKSIVLEKFKDAPFVEQELEDRILKEGVLTGSAAFGVENNHDLDFVMQYDQDVYEQAIKQCYIDGGKYDYQESFNFYVKLRTWDKPVNIIFFSHTDLYDAWIIANEQFKIILEDSELLREIIKDRKQRIAIFEGFRTAAKISIINKREGEIRCLIQTMIHSEM